MVGTCYGYERNSKEGTSDLLEAIPSGRDTARHLVSNRFQRRVEWACGLKRAFGNNVDFVGDNRVIFDIGGNKYRLVVHFSYKFKTALIKFVGTHKEYDGIDAETV
jgi:mRNA-degrading endonuclease HigB of HigAB toxin-antitoxin module